MSTSIWASPGERTTTAQWPSADQVWPWCGTSSRLNLFGVPLDRVSLSQAVERLEGWIQRRGHAHLVFTPDTTALMRARRDDTLKEAYRRADLITADGTGLVWASRVFGASLPERVAGIDIIEGFCPRAAEKGYRLFLLGAKPGVAEQTAQNLRARVPSLQVVGTHHGYFDGGEDEAVLRKIQQADPDLLLVGMGVPRQEGWILRMKDRLNVPVIMGVGGSFDVLSGRLTRAPQAWQKFGLEWLWRALREPYRFWRARVIPVFLLKIFFYRLLQLFA